MGLVHLVAEAPQQALGGEGVGARGGEEARLALDLDDALARMAALEKARDEVLRRLDNAGAGVAAALEAAGSAAARED